MADSVYNQLKQFVSQENGFDFLMVIVCLILVYVIGILLKYICRKIFIPIINKIVQRTHTIWDDYLLNEEVLKNTSNLIPPILLYIMFPWIERQYATGIDSVFMILAERLINISLIVITTRLLFVIVSHAAYLSVSHERLQRHYIAGVFQFVKLLIIAIGSICIVAALVDRSPINFIAGLGAAATVLMLVFKDVILGLVAGIQLTTNNMLKLGDWITLPKENIEGTVEEISLVAVKIRGFDNTIYTIPPYTLTSGIFQNWQPMAERNGRRVKRSVYIDVNSIVFYSPEQIGKLKEKGLYAEEVYTKLDRTTNLTLYRRYVEFFMAHDEQINKSYYTLVRQQQSTGEGIPIEFYFFFYETSFVQYEKMSADYMDYFIAMLPQFGLRAYQRPSGTDLRHIQTFPEPNNRYGL